HWFVSGCAVRLLHVDVERAISVGSEGDFLSVGRPDRIPIIGSRKREPVRCLARAIENPQTAAWGRIEHCRDLLAIRRNSDRSIGSGVSEKAERPAGSIEPPKNTIGGPEAAVREHAVG